MSLDLSTPAVKRQESKRLPRLHVCFCHTTCTQALYKERGLLTASGKDIKNKEPDAVWEPEKVAVIHCQGHKKEDTPQARETALASIGLSKIHWSPKPTSQSGRGY